MPSSYSSLIRLEKMANGEADDVWGTNLNQVLEMIEDAISGRAAVTHDDTANYTLTTANGTVDEARMMIQNIAGALTAARNVVCPTSAKLYVVKNATSGGFAFTFKTTAGTGISVPNGKTMLLFCDGTNVVEALDQINGNLAIAGTLAVTGASTLTGALTVNSTGTSTIAGPLALSGASAGQIVFPATQNASSNVNTFDDYEEGTASPSVAFGGASVGLTLGTQIGRYTKFGNRCAFNCDLVLTAKGSSTGSAQITGLPVVSQNTAGSSTPGGLFLSVMSTITTHHVIGRVLANTNTAELSYLTAGSAADITEAMFNDTTIVRFGAVYECPT